MTLMMMLIEDYDDRGNQYDYIEDDNNDKNYDRQGLCLQMSNLHHFYDDNDKDDVNHDHDDLFHDIEDDDNINSQTWIQLLLFY